MAKPASNPWVFVSPYSRYRRYMQAMAAHETGNFTSRAFKANNNLFGMKNAVHGRKESQLGKAVDGDPYRKYDSPGQSVRDLLAWMKFTNFPTNIGTVDSFVAALKDRGYFEDSESNYLNGVKSFL